MPVLRHAPGETAPLRGTYVLVGHYGEPKGLAATCSQGERLPLAAADDDGPLWWVLVALATEEVQAA